MKNNDYSQLGSQIGDVGGSEINTSEKLKGKKLSNPASYGGKKQLSDEEKQSMEAFLHSAKTKEKITKPVSISSGWIPIDRKEMGGRSLFYPSTWKFYARPATTTMIKNWTSINEDEPSQVNDVFNDIIKTSIKIDTGTTKGAGWAQINSWDRFWFILKVREYTFDKGEHKIEFSDECSNCGEDVTYILNSYSLAYDFPDEELIEKYWDGEKWIINPTEYDVQGEQITLYTPKLGKDNAIINWATEKMRNNQKINDTMMNFLQYAIWMIDKPSSDMAMLDRQIMKAYTLYKSWDLDLFSFITDVIKNITINPSEKLKTLCPSCNQEVCTDVQFPKGIKSLFAVATTGKKFGSR